MEKTPRRLIAVLTIVGVLALAPAALAQSSGTGYGGQAGGVAGQVQQGGGGGGSQAVAGEVGAGGGERAAAANVSGGGGGGVLPFTGLDLALIVGGGFALIACGVALSRVVSRNPA